MMSVIKTQNASPKSKRPLSLNCLALTEPEGLRTKRDPVHWLRSVMSLASLLLFLASSPAQPVINTVAGSGRSLRGLGGPANSVALAQPQFLATDTTGNVYVSDDVYDVVVKISTDGKMNLVAGTGRFEFNGEVGPAASISFRLPQGIVIDRAGNVYVGDSENQLVRKVTPDGELSTFAGCRCFSWGEGGPASQAWLENIGSIAADPAGDL